MKSELSPDRVIKPKQVFDVKQHHQQIQTKANQTQLIEYFQIAIVRIGYRPSQGIDNEL